MKLHILGSCSGTEPMPNRHQTSMMLEIGGRLYVIDAGENCAWQAYTSGLDVTEIQAIFITHPHHDHFGGLPHLLATLCKLDSRRDGCMKGRHIDIFTSCRPAVETARQFLEYTNHCRFNYELEHHELSEGVIFTNDDLSLEAKLNRHLREPLSFSFRVRAQGRTIVFSGDVGSITDLEPWLSEPVDLLLMETGHHTVAGVCEYVATRPTVRHLTFIHHGREILYRFHDCVETAQGILGADRVCIAHDGQIVPLDEPLNHINMPSVEA